MLVVGRTRTGVMIEVELAERGRLWCVRHRVGFGVLLEQALPGLDSADELRAEPGPRQLVRVRVDAKLWLAEQRRWVAAPGVVCDSALRKYLPPPAPVPFDLTGRSGG